MKIEYKDGLKIITHPSGVVSRYTVSDIQAQKDAIQARIDAMAQNLSNMDTDMTNCSASVTQVKKGL